MAHRACVTGLRALLKLCNTKTQNIYTPKIYLQCPDGAPHTCAMQFDAWTAALVTRVGPVRAWES